MKENFAKDRATGFFILKFRLLDRMVDDLRGFGTLSVLDASPIE